MARPQNSPRGNFAKNKITVGSQELTNNSTALILAGGLTVSALRTMTGNSTALVLDGGLTVSSLRTITGNSTALVLDKGVKISNSQTITANSTAILLPTRSTLPTTRQVGGLVFVSNSTGKMLAYHSTGTTWVYASKTSVLA